MQPQAIRSSFVNHFDDKMIGLDTPEVDDIDEERQREMDALAEIASLQNHPGYQKIRAAREKTIEHYASGSFLGDVLANSDITDERLGQMTRVGLLLAEELRKELKSVESAESQIEADKAEKRERRKQRRTT